MSRIIRLARDLAFLTLVVGALGLVACNTVEGMGEDMERGGEALQDRADN